MTSERVVHSADYVQVKTVDEGNGNGKHHSTARCVTVILAVLLLCAIVTIIALATVMILTDRDKAEQDEKHPKEKSVCDTPDCAEAASRIYRSIDASVKPCDDFYQYACGGWLKSHVIPDHETSFSVYSDLRETRDHQIRDLLKEAPKADDIPALRNARNLYASCVNEDLIEERGVKPFTDWLHNTFPGGWPLTNPSWNDDVFDLTDTIAKMFRHGRSALIGLYVSTDPKNSTTRVLMIDQPHLGMPGQKYYYVSRNDTMLTAYETFIFKVAEKLGLADPATAKEEVRDIVDFEIELAEIMVRSEDRRDINKLYNPTTLAEVDNEYSKKIGIDFKGLLMKLVSVPEVAIRDISDQEKIIDRSPEFFDRLGGLLWKTNKRTLVNYLISRIVMKYVFTTTKAFRDLRTEYNTIIYGNKEEKRRDLKCASFTKNWMYFAVGRGYVSRHFDKSSKDEAMHLITYLQTAFNELVDESPWMDEKTKRVAKEKNEYIRPRIGYSENIFNDTIFEESPYNMTFHPEQLFENKQIAIRTYFDYTFKELRKPIDKETWYSDPATINAYYNFPRNEIMFPAGILQPPFFKKDYPKVLNFGGIGTIIGHEITHGFDDRGRQFDKDGNLLQWWDDDIIEKFKNKTKCMVDQYSQFVVDEETDLHLDGIKTQGENIADNGGVKESYRAYTNWVKRQGKQEPKLPGLNFTNDQLFFVAFAQLWCVKDRKEALINRVRSGRHSPGQFRVLGTVKNSKDFSNAFRCPKGSAMNPELKCSVW